MLKNASAPVGTEVEDIDLVKLLEDVDINIDELGIPELGIDELELDEEEEDGLGELGRARRARRRGRKSRRGRARARKGGKKGRRGKKVRMPKGKSKKAKAARGRLIAKILARTKTGRFKSRKTPIGVSGIEGSPELMDLMALSAIDSLGAVKGKRRGKKGRKASRKASRKAGRKGRRRGRKGMRGLAGLADMANGLAEVEVANSMPVLGVFQYLATPAGLEALGGVALGAVVPGLVGRGIFGKLIGAPINPLTGAPKDWYWDVASSLVGAIGVWEFGRLIGAGNAAKFGAFYALGSLIDRLLLTPWVLDKILPVPGRPTSGLGQILFPGVKRPDYATNPLSGFGTVRIPDQDELKGLGTVRIPDQDPSLGTVRIPDTEMVGVGEDIVTEEELLGQDDGTSVEDSEIF